MNVELLRQVEKVIQGRPEKFDMGNFTGIGPCGTQHCIGGWADVLTGGDPNSCSSSAGRRALGLERDEAFRLFFCSEWPEQFQRGEDGWDITPDVAAARIEHFIATEGRE